MTTHTIVSLDSETAIRITPPGTHSGLDVTIQNINETGYVYVGGEGVTTTDYGFRISPNAAVSFELPGYDALYLIGSTSVSAAVITTGLEIGD